MHGPHAVAVEVLQRSWMRDDYATITNTYPDHEDLQGPADSFPKSSAVSFRNSTVVTSEETMLPILQTETDK